MIAFFAATPFQVFNCINIKLSSFQSVDADIYILSYAGDNKGLLEICKNSELFKNVYYLSEPFNGHGRIRFLKSYLFPNRELVTILKSKRYEQIFSTRIGPAAEFYYTFLRKQNKEVAFNYYEECVGDYFLEIAHRQSALVKLIKLFGYKNPFDSFGKLWLYRPELLFANNGYPNERIPTVEKGSQLCNKIQQAFKLGEITLPIDCKLIYLDQPFKRQQNIDINNIAVLDVISKVIAKENIFVKMYPLDRDSSYENAGNNVLTEKYCPWEVLFGAYDFSDIILVAINSTAVVTPFTVYGVEQKAVRLYNYFDISLINFESQKKYFNACMSSYSDKGRITTPCDDASLIHALEQMQRNEETR